jgi:hypothetical protein
MTAGAPGRNRTGTPLQATDFKSTENLFKISHLLKKIVPQSISERSTLARMDARTRQRLPNEKKRLYRGGCSPMIVVRITLAGARLIPTYSIC